MGELSKDTVMRLALGSVGSENRRLLQRLLADAQNVSAFELADDGTLLVSLHSDQGESELARVFSAIGIYPQTMADVTGFSSGGFNAC